ncbi:uncharacterized protein K02A2.6-like [Aedes albopictus]|uniref:Integrase catalytic domain-containing protein n=1 Tax=Aedes albopictus TaxID=7160 RepID=A0ABM1Y6F4_AEDAL
MDIDVDAFVKKCRGCTLVSAPDPPEPMSRRNLPSGPWQDVAIDFLGPLPEGQFLLVVVDYYSRYFEVCEMSSITAESTIEELRTIFCRFGVPITLTADNAPQLSEDCEQFAEFCRSYGIKLINTVPYWPQMNGEVERQNRTILKRLQISQELGQDWRVELQTFLLTYRASNHSTTGRSPAEMMFGRRIRTKLPQLSNIRVDDEAARDRDAVQKEKGKEYSDSRRGARPAKPANPKANHHRRFVSDLPGIPPSVTEGQTPPSVRFRPPGPPAEGQQGAITTVGPFPASPASAPESHRRACSRFVSDHPQHPRKTTIEVQTAKVKCKA